MKNKIIAMAVMLVSTVGFAQGAPVAWVAISGGKYTMGTDLGYVDDDRPAHEVSLHSFEMSKTLVTVAQYAECVSAGRCAEPATDGPFCNWGKPGRDQHPVNCVDWDQTNQFAKFAGARLPTESEYEYAATAEGQGWKYPWGEEDATCERAVMFENGYGCGHYGTMPVCSKPAGNTPQGLCDMVGDAWEWMQDKYQDSYVGAPTDGSAIQGAGPDRVLRGGSFFVWDHDYLRSGRRDHADPADRGGYIGIRLVR